MSPGPPPRFDRDVALTLRRSGLSYDSIASRLGVSGSGVAKVLHALGEFGDIRSESARRRYPKGAPVAKRWPSQTVEERFRSKFTVHGDGCWIWHSTTNHGYGWFGDESGVPRNAHRIAWELWIGPIPPRMVLDHICHTNDLLCFDGPCQHRRCVNPDHLEVVTLAENKRRGHDRMRNFHLVDLLA